MCTHTHEEWGINVRDNWGGMQLKKWNPNAYEIRHQTFFFYAFGLGWLVFSWEGDALLRSIDVYTFKYLEPILHE